MDAREGILGRLTIVSSSISRVDQREKLELFMHMQ